MKSGTLARESGNFRQAESDFRQAFDETGESDADTVRALGEIGSLLLTKGQLDEVESVLNRATGMLRANHALNQRQLPVLLGMLGN